LQSVARICGTLAGLLLAGLLLVATPVLATPADDALLAAHESWTLRDVAGIQRAIKNMGSDPLSDYPDYWLLDLRLAQPGPPPSADVKNFLVRYPNSPLLDPLRITWLKALARAQDWDTFTAQVTQNALEDAEVVCDHFQNRLLKQDTSVVRDARALWFLNKIQPDSCVTVFHQLTYNGTLSNDDMWIALRQALGDANLNLAHIIIGFLPSAQAPSELDLSTAYNRPLHFLENWRAADNSPATHELALFALAQYAAHSPEQAITQLNRLAPRFSAHEISYAWLQIAYQGTLAVNPKAITWFRNVSDPLNDDVMRSWRIRAALRAQNWEEVSSGIAQLSSTEARQPVWRYWKARALAVLNNPDEAHALLTELSQESGFYGLLALEDLGGQFQAPAAPPAAQVNEVIAVAPHFERAFRLHQLGLATDAQFEWKVADRTLNSRERLAAATLAARGLWIDRAIYSIERAGDQQDYELRYPLPYRDALHTWATQNQLDEAWVYGLTRQESHFFPEARSRSGALGLMQLMPATARWIARRIPLKGFQPATITRADVSLQLGSAYLHYLLNVTGNPILATAAYNAGPHRVRGWIPETPLEAAVFIETIPVAETRNYVKHVFYNSTVYNQRLGLPAVSLKRRLGTLSGAKPVQNNEIDPVVQP
jgi:soluble lytic murein transglycosylase